jgi:ribosomal protein S5
MGNCNGVIGYGTGSGMDFEDALDKATNNCKKNLVAINLDHFLSWPRKITETV